jgi:hypothetical protein
VKHAFYYWRTTFHLSEADIAYFNTLHINTLYVKFFDVGWQSDTQMAVPLTITQFASPIPQHIEIIPTIFITNATMQNIDEPAIEQLAEKILKKIGSMLLDTDAPVIQEIQLDCDWTTGTREKYFSLLKALQSRVLERNIVVSATIRLHQIKYRQQTGIPPVSKGMLMCYNIASPTQFDVHNSILESQHVAPYITNLDTYPLPLDVVLPIFSWGVLFYHDEFIKLINNTREQNLLDHPDFERYAGNVFHAKRNTYLNTTYIYQDSLIRVEEMSAKMLKQNARLLASHLPKPMNARITFFHYDPAILKAYRQDDLQDIYSIFSREKN